MEPQLGKRPGSAIRISLGRSQQKRRNILLQQALDQSLAQARGTPQIPRAPEGMRLSPRRSEIRYFRHQPKPKYYLNKGKRNNNITGDSPEVTFFSRTPSPMANRRSRAGWNISPENRSCTTMTSYKANSKSSPVRSSPRISARRRVEMLQSTKSLLNKVYQEKSTLTIEEMISLSRARTDDNRLGDWEQHILRFIDRCLRTCLFGRLCLPNLRLGERSAAALRNALLNPKISELVLSHNELGNEGMKIISKGILETKSLVHLL